MPTCNVTIHPLQARLHPHILEHEINRMGCELRSNGDVTLAVDTARGFAAGPCLRNALSLDRSEILRLHGFLTHWNSHLKVMSLFGI